MFDVNVMHLDYRTMCGFHAHDVIAHIFPVVALLLETFGLTHHLQ